MTSFSAACDWPAVDDRRCTSLLVRDDVTVMFDVGILLSDVRDDARFSRESADNERYPPNFEFDRLGSFVDAS